jgi:hypothetical protein
LLEGVVRGLKLQSNTGRGPSPEAELMVFFLSVLDASKVLTEKELVE